MTNNKLTYRDIKVGQLFYVGKTVQNFAIVLSKERVKSKHYISMYSFSNNGYAVTETLNNLNKYLEDGDIISMSDSK